MRRARHTCFHVGGGADAGCDDRWRFADQPGIGQILQALPDQAEGSFGNPRHRVPNPHIMAGAGENHGPGAANQPGSDDGDLFHGVTSPLAGLDRARHKGDVTRRE